jgi:hypothetical protein
MKGKVQNEKSKQEAKQELLRKIALVIAFVSTYFFMIKLLFL